MNGSEWNRKNKKFISYGKKCTTMYYMPRMSMDFKDVLCEILEVIDEIVYQWELY